MIKFKLVFVVFSFLLISGCGGSDQQTSVENSEVIQLVNESDSLSSELSSASDSIDKKVKDLQSALENLNN